MSLSRVSKGGPSGSSWDPLGPLGPDFGSPSLSVWSPVVGAFGSHVSLEPPYPGPIASNVPTNFGSVPANVPADFLDVPTSVPTNVPTKKNSGRMRAH